VDDILIFGTNIDVINDVKSFLSKSFDMKDLGEVDVILNIKLIKDENGITLSQSHYVEKIEQIRLHGQQAISNTL
jgi:tRNA(Ser,Leu) C12 N-acetylase TAN1